MLNFNAMFFYFNMQPKMSELMTTLADHYVRTVTQTVTVVTTVTALMMRGLDVVGYDHLRMDRSSLSVPPRAPLQNISVTQATASGGTLFASVYMVVSGVGLPLYAKVHIIVSQIHTHVPQRIFTCNLFSFPRSQPMS